MAITGGLLFVVHACISAARGGRGVPGLDYLAASLFGLPVFWLVVALRLGPLSTKRRSRATFWKGARGTLAAVAAGILVQLTLVAAAIAYASESIASTLGQSAPAYLWEQLWVRGKGSGLIRHFVGWGAAACVMLYAAYRLGPFVRRLEGKCVKCSYRLKGLVEPRCPECGTSFNPAELEGVSAPRAEPEDRRGA